MDALLIGAEAVLHRDAVFWRQSVFIEPAGEPEFTVPMPAGLRGKRNDARPFQKRARPFAYEVPGTHGILDALGRFVQVPAA
ncbi:MAG: hypothetical protein ACREFZ_06085 [Acetobacteraceae bacterium]